MATIHHATAKRAASLGFTLTSPANDTVNVQGHGLDLTFPEGTDAKTALDLTQRAKVTQGEYGITFSSDDGTFTAEKGENVLAEGEDLEEVIAEAIDALQNGEGDEEGEEEAGEGEEAAEEAEEAGKGSVVPDKYRKLYAERGDANHCGDDLAQRLALLLKSDGVADVERLRLLAALNGIDFARYETDTRGWIGRARMTIGNILRARIRRGEEVQLDLEGPAVQVKPKEKKARKAKAEKAEAPAETTSEG